ncbi:MAG: U32 family peptidase [Planctomycetaceae bacterium]|nr:U32 family peptidase [Planctomycetaceae bacterium]
MSPAGHWPQLRAAVEAGADAVYFGLKHFSARAKVGFTTGELPEVMRELRGRSVRGYVTFNTLVFDHELELAQQAIVAIAEAGCDAIIVQDTGIAELARHIAPQLEIHGSTQMSITSAQGANLAQSLGCTRVVLGRELDLKDIRRIASATTVELETFVHGALCVSYSGQCFSSEAWGGRSANRGQCAQACRLSYQLVVDGQTKELGADRYLLSPGDLYTIEQIPALIDCGIACVKIEGRYKDADYVAMTTAAYRQAIDQYYDDSTTPEPSAHPAWSQQDLEQIYSRGLGPHFMAGTNHQDVVKARAPRHRGRKLAQVVEVGNSFVVVRGEPINRGDGLVLDAANWRSPDEPEEGGNVYEVNQQADGNQRLEFGFDQIDFSRIRVGDWVWRTKDPQLSRRLKRLTQPSRPVHTQPIHLSVRAIVGQPLQVSAELDSGVRSELMADGPLELARNQCLTQEVLAEQLGRLGGTPFHLGRLELQTDQPVFVPTSQLNQTRRDLVDAIQNQLVSYTAGPITPVELATWKTKALPSPDRTTTAAEPAGLHVLVRTAEQLQAAIECHPSSITLDYLELYGLRESVGQVQDADIPCRVASPRILKPNEHNVTRFLLSLECDLLVRSGGLLYELNSRHPAETLPPLDGDFSLNIANAISVGKFLDMGLRRVTPTHDLNAQQIVELASQVSPSKLEVIAYQHMPVFHMEHCVFCRFLSEGTDHTNCGHPCEKHRIAVQDSSGRQHAVLADVGCRNTVFGAEAQSAADHMHSFLEAGIRQFRLEFVHQEPEQVGGIITAFQRFLAGDISVAQLHQTLDKHSPQRTTQGSLFVPDNFKQLVQLQ